MLHVSTLHRFRSFPALLPPLFALWEGSKVSLMSLRPVKESMRAPFGRTCR